MNIESLFSNDITRPIDGVIKADDLVRLKQEVDEYVLTNEVSQELEELLEAYTSSTDANGVWISGFFGSGKSHLLKMLAYLLGDVEAQSRDCAVDRSAVSSSFQEKAEGEFLPALLRKAERIPARSILFNVDQKASRIGKDQADALLRVFVKVFDEARGYYGGNGPVARFERDLDRRGQYQAFQKEYQRIAGKPWSQGREEGILEEYNVSRAFNKVTESSSSEILKTYRTQYEVSIEDFAQEVASWLETQPSGYRLNFFVDEVGQFIGSSTGLMLNLQTIVETLSTHCHGRAWVFVTSQEDMDTVIGTRTASQSHDFSKIQARFANRVKLTSADVEEVIRKRLLGKKENAAETLSSVYDLQQANFSTLFTFADGAKSYRNYPDKDRFIGTYPFVTYQFPLFQEAMSGLSAHNVFEGRYASVGERSMLAVVQQVVRRLGGQEVNALVSFDMLFSGIESALKSGAKHAVDVADRNLDDKLAISLLKALFLVKYVDGFQATARNLTVLTYPAFNTDLPAHAEKVKDALAVLEAQTYVQRRGNAFEFLTNEEKEIEEEIKAVDLDPTLVPLRLSQMLIRNVITSKKARYTRNGQDFDYGRVLDGQIYGQQKELTLHVVTPENPSTFTEVVAQSMGSHELCLVLDADERLMADLRLFLRTEQYLRHKQSMSLASTTRMILNAKSSQNTERERDLVARLRQAVAAAQLVVGGRVLASGSSSDPEAHVREGFQAVIEQAYTQLKLLGGRVYREPDVARFAVPHREDALFADEERSLRPAAEEVLNCLKRMGSQRERATVASLIEKFGAIPYGWDLVSVQAVLAWLVGTSKVRIQCDGKILTRTEVPTALSTRKQYPHLVVEPERSFDARRVSVLQSFLQDLTVLGNLPSEPLELARTGMDDIHKLVTQLEDWVKEGGYPFLPKLKDPISQLQALASHPAEWLLTDFDGDDDILEVREGLITPVQAFMNGPGKKIYDDAVKILREQADNLTYLPDGSDTALRSLLQDPSCYRSKTMTRVKTETVGLREAVKSALSSERTRAAAVLEGRRSQLHDDHDFKAASQEARKRAEGRIAEVLNQVSAASQIAQVRSLVSDFEAHGYADIINDLIDSRDRQISPTVAPDELTGPGPTPGTLSGEPEDTNAVSHREHTIHRPASAARTVITLRELRLPGTPGRLCTEQDVEAYLTALRTAMLDVVHQGRSILL